MKTLKDYQKEIEPKSKDKIHKEFIDRKYRAIEAFYIGVAILIILIILTIIANTKVYDIELKSFNDYIDLRTKNVWISLLSLGERVFWVYIVTIFANRLNRQPLFWQIMAFIIPYLTLIIIGLMPKNDNKFYEYHTSTDKLSFFKSLDLPDKIKLYYHILKRAKIGPCWFDKLSELNKILFETEQTALQSLQEYEKQYSNNLLKEFKSNMPSGQKDRKQFFEPLENIGLINESFYMQEENDDKY